MADAEVSSSFESGGSFLVSSLTASFKNVLRLEVDRDAIREAKEKQKKDKKKKKDKEKEEDKPKKELEEKQIVREGGDSFITSPTASSFAVFSHVRHLVLQQQLCDKYNSRNRELTGTQDTDEEDEDGENEKKLMKLPKVVTVGIRGVFTILQEIWQTIPELCVKVLTEFLNILQGQMPAGLKNEPSETTTALFELLIKMVSATNESKTSSIASSCLISLVIALGETDKLLEAISALLIVPPDMANSSIKIPTIFRSLQASIEAILLGPVTDTDWLQKGVAERSLIDSWKLGEPVTDDKGPLVSMATDSSYLYMHGPFGLMKVGLGYGSTVKGKIYGSVPDFHSTVFGRLMILSDKLLFYYGEENKVVIVDPENLKTEKEMELDVEALGPMVLFSDGKDLQQIMANKEGGFSLRKLTTLCSPIPVVEQKSLDLMQKSILAVGKARYNPNSSLYTMYQNNSAETKTVIASKSFTAVLTTNGQLFYQGSGSVFGLSDKDVPKGEWKKVAFPSNVTSFSQVEVDHTGSFCLAVTEAGGVYFAGTNRKGEAGENAGRQPPQAAEFKKIGKLKDKHITGCAGGTQQSAFVDKEGKMYLFGQVEDDLVDKQTGVVTGLLGVPISHVAMGRSHICVLTQLGTVYTFGNNQYGQCGRNYIPPEEGQDVAAVDNEDEGSDDEDDDDDMEFNMCSPEDHDWGLSRCMVCKFCNFCTGYGPTCCNEGMPGREPGSDCGCGSGDAGCTVCGACKVCAGESESWNGGMSLYDLESEDPEAYQQILHTRSMNDTGDDESGDEKKLKKKKKKGGKDKEEKGGNMGLQLLFGGKGDSDEEDKNEESGASPDKKVDEKLSTKKPGLLLLPDDNTVMAVACGLSHSVVLLHNGEVYAFGNNSHGQLGQGNKKHCGHPVKIPLPDSAKQISCGEFHTVVLLSSGEIYSFGKNDEGQLGRKRPQGLEEKAEDSNWNCVPGLVDLESDYCKVKWVYAVANQTFIAIDQSLVSDTTLSRCRVFANSQCIGIVPVSAGVEKSTPNVVMIDKTTMTAKKFDGDEQANLGDCSLCVDPEYSMLWAYDARKGLLSCYNPVASEVKDTAGTVLVPPLCLPQSKDATISRCHAGLNLLSSLHTACTRPPPSVLAIGGGKMRSFSVDEFKCVNRFNAHGGGWGYSSGAEEAIKLSPDHDVLLGGFGLFCGPSQFSASIKVYDVSDGPDEESLSSPIATGEEKNFSGAKTKTNRILLDRPVLLAADKWYTVVVTISSDAGGSSGAGASGLEQVTGQDKVVFKFKNSKHSNNSTDVSSGQIPEILYRSPELEQDSGVSLQILDKSFSSTVTFNGLQAVQSILEWSWNICQKEPNNELMRIVVKNSLGILSSHIQEVYPSKGINKKALQDSPELAEAVFNILDLIKRIFSSPGPPTDTPTGNSNEDVMNQCKETFTSCFHAFYPSATLKWFSLCNLLQSIDPSDIIVGFHGDKLLSAVLEALSSPEYSFIGLSYDTPFNLALALENISDNCRFPMLTEFMHCKTKEEFSFGGELMTFKAISNKLLSLISASLQMEISGETVPCANVVSRAGEFLLSRFNELALCSSYPSLAAYSGVTVSNTKKKDKLWETSVRFPSREMGHPEMISNDVTFSVNKPVTVHGFGIYGDTENEYTYTITLLKDGDSIASGSGSFTASDCHGEEKVANLMFSSSCKLEQNVVYIARVTLKGKAYTLGTEGKETVFGQGGVVFTFLSTGLDESNPSTGPLARFLCSSIISAPQTVVQLSVHMASMLLDLTVGFLTRILHSGPTSEVLQALSSSYLMSNLLPSVLAQLGTIASQQPESAVAVLDMIKRTLPIISATAKSFKEVTNPGSQTPENEYMDSKLLHYANVETEHPYKPATVSHYRVRFPEQVKWLSLEFDSKCGFAQSEDKLMSVMIPRDKKKDSATDESSSEQSVTVTPMMGVNFEDIYSNFQNFGLPTPAGLVVLPGNEVHIVVGTDTEYEKKDKSNHYGIKCKVIGYEWSDNAHQCLALLEKELVTLGAMCGGALLSEDLNLPFAEELAVVPDSVDSEKADMRIVQAAAQEVLSKHCNLLGHGLYSDPPSVTSALKGDVTTIVNSAEQQFLHDFIKSKSDSSGGRLARWLQPDRSVDPDASVIDIITPPDEMQVGKKIECTVCTKDQNGKTVYVKGMTVEVKCEWKGRSVEETTSLEDGVDSVMGVRKPTFKRPFTTTSLGSTNVYQTIPMMMPYSDYSFEELRFYAPKVIGSVDLMNVVSNDDGTYSVNWVPSTSGTYNIRISIDGSLSGDDKTIEVSPKEPTVPLVEKQSDETPEDEGTSSEEEKVVVEVIKKKKFPFGRAPGLRIRQEPSLQASCVGIINPGEVFIYTDEVENEVGKWAKLSPKALEQFKCTKPEGYALAYSKQKNSDVLDEVEPEEVKHIVGGTVSFKKRRGGPGTYSVVHCGAAGHNIRTKPGMKGVPVGRLAKDSKVEIEAELENDDGIWLKLSPSSAKSFCDPPAEEAWTLVVHPSGRIFLAQEGDNSYMAFEPQPSSMQASFPSAASVFGTQEPASTTAASIFGSNVPAAPPPPGTSLFGSSKSSDSSSSGGPAKVFSSLGGKLKLSFGEDIGGKSDKPPAVFQFTSASSPANSSDSKTKESSTDKPTKPEEGPRFSIGISDSDKQLKSPRKPRPESSTPSAKDDGKPLEEKVLLKSSILSSSSLTKAQALSPAVAECQRAIFAAFLWQENLVHDAMAAAIHLKMHPDITKETRLDMTKKDQKEQATKDGGEESPDNEKDDAGTGEPEDDQSSTQSLPPTINHLVTFWDEIAVQVVSTSNVPFAPPKVPSLAEELQRLYDEEKKEMEKMKKEKNKKAGGAGGGGGGSTVCELCDQSFPDPVTYHMKEAHPGCRKHASGWGYNSRGTFCSGWAGNCGDGGRGGSTWYLMCKDCHAKYLQMKEETKKKAPKQIVLPKMKCRKPGKPRNLKVVSAVQGMILNAKFLLDISADTDVPKTKLTTPTQKISFDESKDKTSSLPRKQGETQEAPLPSITKPMKPPTFNRSMSMATDVQPKQRIHSDGGEDSLEVPPSLARQKTVGPPTKTPVEEAESTGLIMKPSMALAKLMYQRSRKGLDSKDTGYNKVMSFVQRYHDLEGLRVSMKQAMRVAVLRSYALEFLEWLLYQVSVPSVVHDVLWHFMSAISNHPMITAANQAKENNDEPDKEPTDWSLGKHPLTGLEGAGSSLVMLRKKFHSLLQTIANIMNRLPVGSSAQQMALKCWCLKFQPQDQSFLLQSRVFANISDTLSSMEGSESDKAVQKNTEKLKANVKLMTNCISDGKLKVSGNEAMSHSLTDNSTETFWECRSKQSTITIKYDKPRSLVGACIHIDNQKDAGQRVDEVTLTASGPDNKTDSTDKCNLVSNHSGWKLLMIPSDAQYDSITLAIKGSGNTVRVRQVVVLGVPDKPVPGSSIRAEVAMLKDCEAEALRLFRLLTAQVFGGLLSDEVKEGEDETDSVGEEETDDGDGPSSMANILFNNKSVLSGLQRSVCLHVMDSVHTEAEKIKTEWETTTAKEKGVSKPAPSRQVSHDPTDASKGKGVDTYCYELLTMLSGLSQNELGCTFLAEHEQLVKDLVTLLHTASTRIQSKTCDLLRHILPYIKPKDFALMLGVTTLPPLGYSAIAEAVNSAGTVNQLGLLDCFLAVISKALSVQVKAKGRGSNILQALTGESSISAITLGCLKNPKIVAGEGTVKSQRWYLKGGVSQDIAAEVMKLLRDMTKGDLKGQWKDYAKSAIGQAVLHVTKIAEEARNADPGMYSQTIWLCLAALCVIDEEHADALSSGQWLGQDGQPQHKPLCDNHDDGETKALILCEECGNLCGECDRVLHYHRLRNNHQRQVFKEEEEAVKVDLHEGCGRIKLYWTMALADSRTLKGMVEFKDTIGGGGGKASCRFCGLASTPGLLPIGNVCSDPECQERAKNVCEKTLSCGHHCCGVKDETKCLPCLHGCDAKDEDRDHPQLKQDADDMCMICYTEGLSCAPCIQLECGHVFHYHCCHSALTTKWSGPRITFRFMFCSICENKPISHPHLLDITKPLFDLYEDVKRKCLLRLEYENQTKCEAVTSPSSKYYQKPQDYALWKYAYYVCHKCKKAYYGGEAHCAEAAGNDEYDPTELVCPACSHTGQVQTCAKHGTDFLEYKCRYCCSVAVYFCFGTTHFCNPCHDDFQRVTSIPKSELPMCPVGPRAKPLSGTECPLHVKHPPTGEEFALGCGVCRNAQTF